MKNTDNPIAIYTAENGQTQIDVRVSDDTVWLTAAQIGVLFDVDRTVILKHIKNIYMSEELGEVATCANFAQVQNEGNRLVTRHPPLISLGAVRLCGTPDDLTLSNLLVVIKKGNVCRLNCCLYNYDLCVECCKIFVILIQKRVCYAAIKQSYFTTG